MACFIYFIGEVHPRRKGKYTAIKIGLARNIAKRLDDAIKALEEGL